MKTFLVNRTTNEAIRVRRNGQDILFRFNDPREVANDDLAAEMAANNPNLTVIKQAESGRVFVENPGTQTVTVRYFNIPYHFAPNKFTEVATKEMANQVASEYNNAAIGGTRLTVHVEGEDGFTVDDKKSVFLPESEKQAVIE